MGIEMSIETCYGCDEQEDRDGLKDDGEDSGKCCDTARVNLNVDWQIVLRSRHHIARVKGKLVFSAGCPDILGKSNLCIYYLELPRPVYIILIRLLLRFRLRRRKHIFHLLQS